MGKPNKAKETTGKPNKAKETTGKTAELVEALGGEGRISVEHLPPIASIAMTPLTDPTQAPTPAEALIARNAKAPTAPTPFTRGAIAEMVAAVPAAAKRSGKGNGIAECSAKVIKWLGGSGSASVVAALLDPTQVTARPIIEAMVAKRVGPEDMQARTIMTGSTPERLALVEATEIALLADLGVSRPFTSKGSTPAAQVSKAIWVQAQGHRAKGTPGIVWVSENVDKDGLFRLTD